MASAEKRKCFVEVSSSRPADSRRFSGKNKRSHMTVSKMFKGLLLGLSVLLATGAFAASKGSLQVNAPVSVAGKQLAAGNYEVKWDGSGPNVELSILKGKNVVATVPAQIVNLDRSPEDNAAVVRTDENGSRVLAQIRFSGKKTALQIGGEASGSSSGGSSIR
jgi:hypothetical protein